MHITDGLSNSRKKTVSFVLRPGCTSLTVPPSLFLSLSLLLSLPPSLSLPLHPVSYASHPQFVPFELLEESKREELRTFTLDLLRYLKVSGFAIAQNRLFSGMTFALSMDGGIDEADSSEEKKFCFHFFEIFLSHLSIQNLELSFYFKVLFPVMTSYLQHHRAYFMPSEGQRGHSFASREEKEFIVM